MKNFICNDKQRIFFNDPSFSKHALKSNELLFTYLYSIIIRHNTEKPKNRYCSDKLILDGSLKIYVPW